MSMTDTVMEHRPFVTSAPEASDREPDPLGFGAIAVLGAVLSLVVTGFVFGTSNNLFHLPIIGRLYDEPQFAHDAYMQSLHYFAAGPFLLLQGADRFIDPQRLFLGLLFVSRLLSFIGFLACMRLLGVVTRQQRLLAALLLCFTSILQGGSFAGGGGMFVEYFTHSEIANGLSLIALYYAARGKLTSAFAWNGATFFANAFVAVWNAAPLGCIIVVLLVRGRLRPMQVVTRGAIGLVIFAILASPVVANVLANPEFGRPTAFDYPDFLAEAWPFHFLFHYTSLGARLGLATIFMTAALAFVALWRRGVAGADMFLAALIGFAVVYAFGIVAPMLTRNAAVINLHLLRSGGSMHLLASLGGVALATCWQTSPERRESRVFGPLLIVLLCSVRPALFLAPVLIVASMVSAIARRMPGALLRGRAVTQLALVVVLLVLWPYAVFGNWRANAQTQGRIDQWAEIGAWARANTPPDAIFLVPTANLRDIKLHPAMPVEPHQIWQGAEIFDYASHRRVWIDFKRASAVMWSPSFYPIWEQRDGDVLRLATLGQKLAYAAGHGVGYVVDGCFENDGNPVLFHTSLLCVFAASSQGVPPGAPAAIPAAGG